MVNDYTEYEIRRRTGSIILKSVLFVIIALFIFLNVVDDLIKNQGRKVGALVSDEKWYGVTYKDDAPLVRAALTKLMEEGYYDGI